MDLNTITLSDFKTLFKRDFAYLPVWSDTKLYNEGNRVYYTTTELFYDCKVDGTIGTLPTVTTAWTRTTDDIENYIQDDDLTKAFAEAKVIFNQGLFDSDENIKLGFLYLVAHYLVHDLRAALNGLNGSGSVGILSSRSVGNVSESYGIPQAYMDDPAYAFFTSSAYGLKYLSMVWGKLRGNFGVVCGATLA